MRIFAVPFYLIFALYVTLNELGIPSRDGLNAIYAYIGEFLSFLQI